jgi:cytochrome d ubiquinol oxidase subunit I
VLPILAADALLPARYQMAVSLGWHIVIAAFGVAFPAIIFVAHRRGLRGDQAGLVLAPRWVRSAARSCPSSSACCGQG